ncbi:MAG: HEAT repeat domain-containing protein [Cyanobacteria bacterium J06621_12]
MTYIKPEKAANQSSSVQKILDQGYEAVQRQNWLEVSNLLRELPLGKSTGQNKRFILEATEWQKAFDLAQMMLVQADFQHKWEISKIFPWLGQEIIPALSSLSLDQTAEAEVRWFSCQILGHFSEQSVVLTLVQLLQQSDDSELIAIAGKTLIKIGDRAIDALVELRSQPEYALLAVKSLSYIRTTATVEPLLAVTTEENAELRRIAINALGSFHDQRVAPVLITALQDQASIVRREAAIALGFRPDLCKTMNLVQYLQPLLYDLNLEVCRQAAISLGRMRQQTAVAALYEVLQSDTTPISLKSDLVKALGWSRQSSAILYLKRALTNASELIIQEIVTILGRISTPELKPESARVLINFWQQRDSPSAILRQTLATSLGELGDRSARLVLEQLAQDSDRKVKLHAIAALKKLPTESNQ